MVPAGSVSEQQLDVDLLSLRSLLLPYCTSIKFRVKHAVSELLFQLCDEQRQHNKAKHIPQDTHKEWDDGTTAPVQSALLDISFTSSHSLRWTDALCCICSANEFIRLCGLGNAIGLLADKGMPGQPTQNNSVVTIRSARTSSGHSLVHPSASLTPLSPTVLGCCDPVCMLPGFNGLTQQAISLDALMAARNNDSS